VKNRVGKICTVMAAVMLLSFTMLESVTEARIGGGRSMGSRGSRSYSRPATTYSPSSPSRPQVAPAPRPFAQQPGGGFMRSMAGGLMGGMLGSMLFGGVAGAGTGGGMSGGGIGLLDIVLLAGAGYLVYGYVRKSRAERSSPFHRR
jgi:predicted lipid-binding transport protein (Tim44 family)